MIKIKLQNYNDDYQQKFKQIVIYYPLIIVVCYLPICLARTLQLLQLHITADVFHITESLFYLNGFFNSLIYGYLSYCKPLILQNFKAKKSKSILNQKAETYEKFPIIN